MEAVAADGNRRRHAPTRKFAKNLEWHISYLRFIASSLTSVGKIFVISCDAVDNLSTITLSVNKSLNIALEDFVHVSLFVVGAVVFDELVRVQHV